MKYDVSKGYSENRRTNYPSIADQLDIIFHHGIDAWKREIREIKERFPK